MLFTDAILLTEDSLRAYDSELGIIDDAQSIDITKVILEAQREVGLELLRLAQRFYGRTQSFLLIDDFSAQSRYNESANRPKLSLSQIVATDAEFPGLATALEQYLSAKTIYHLMRNAARRMGGDRYADLRDYWKCEIDQRYWPGVKMDGLPVVDYPLSRPGAYFIPGAGVWNSSNVTVLGSTSDDPVPSWSVAITWFANSQLENNESAPSEIITVPAGSGQSLVLSKAGLAAPTGGYSYASLARVAAASLKAAGWRVYAGPSAGPMTLQASLPLTQSAYTLAVDSVTTTGAALGPGQSALYYMTVADTFDRC